LTAWSVDNFRFADEPDRISTPGYTFLRIEGDIDSNPRNRGLTMGLSRRRRRSAGAICQARNHSCHNP
jgi:hypothetical protein